MNQARRGPGAEQPKPDAAGFVLAGGQSSRMGRYKALLPVAGRPMVAQALSILRKAGLPASIAGVPAGELLKEPESAGWFAGAQSPLTSFALVVEDAEPGLGPLAGVCAALASTSACCTVFLPVDLPLLPPSLLVFLLHHARITGRAVTVPTVNGFTQTFPAVLDRALLPALQAELSARRGGCFSAFQAAAASLDEPISAVTVEFLAQSGQIVHPLGLPPALWFLNLNSPEDLERAEALLERSIA